MERSAATECKTEAYRFDPFSTMRWLLSAIVLTAFWMVFEWYTRNHVLHDMLAQTRMPWRQSQDELFPLTIVLPLSVALIISSAYRNFYKRIRIGPVGSVDCPYRKSIKFGIWTGLLIGAVKAQGYLYLVISGKLVATFFVVSVIKGIGTGIVLCTVYQCLPQKVAV